MKTAAFLLLAMAAWSQPLRVYSEFAQIDATGKVIAPAEPREILSPAIVRNGFSTFQIVVDVPQGTSYQLYVAQNPENAVEVTLYRATSKGMERLDQPVSSTGTQVFWMDLWTAREAPVARIKVEPQLHVNNDWVIYPMEARVVSATVPDGPKTDNPRTVRDLLCGPTRRDYTYIVDLLRDRNVEQDVALARVAPKEELRKVFGPCNAPTDDPEWYLRIRDYLLRLPQTVR